MSPFKAAASCCHVKDNFRVAQSTATASEMIESSRVPECPVQMEAELVAVNKMKRDEEGRKGVLQRLEGKIL